MAAWQRAQGTSPMRPSLVLLGPPAFKRNLIVADAS